MSTRADLTRWNRAGLSQLAYVDGNAATYLEVLRAALSSRFPDWNDLRVEAASEVAEGPLELDKQELERLEHQYVQGPGGWTNNTAARIDWLWEIARALARATHVLGGHLDAYANESFLRTATQWENVRRLVSLIDYRPGPPASASTYLTLTAAASATITNGFKVKHSPEDGSPVIFETLEDIDVDPELNALRASEYDHDQTHLRGDTLTLDGFYKDIVRGQPVVLEHVSALGEVIERVALHVEAVRTESEVTLLDVSPSLPHRFISGYTRIHAAPKDTLAPLGPVAEEVDANEPTSGKGATVQYPLRLKDDPTGVNSGDIIWIGRGDGAFRRVVGVDNRTLFLDGPVEDIDPEADMVGIPARVAVRKVYERPTGTGSTRVGVLMAGDWSVRLGESPVVARLESAVVSEFSAIDASYHMPGSTAEGLGENAAYPGYTVVGVTSMEGPGWNPRYFYVAPASGAYRIDTYLHATTGRVPLTLTTSESRKAAHGGLVVVARGRQHAWAQLADVHTDADTGTTELEVASWDDRGGGRYWVDGTTVYTGFSVTARPLGADVNMVPLTGAIIPVDAVPSAVYAGRRATVTASDDAFEAFTTAIASFDQTSVTIEDELPADATVGNVVLAANVVLAGHGETQSERILGSGDATRRNQEFTLEVDNVSFLADPSFSTGVRADIAITIGVRTWTQVESLSSSGPSEECYTARISEDGNILVQFGDGTNGRRIPTGTNNIRVTYRKGVGLDGNLAAGCLVKAVAGSDALESIDQPSDATGGADREETSSVRDHASASVLAMGRAVSLSDFAALAASHSSIWQAHARRMTSTSSHGEKVDVVVVPSGGGELGDLVTTLKTYLSDRCQPNVAVTVSAYEPVVLDLGITLRIDELAYEPRLVAEAARQALESGLSLERRRLGEPLHRSEVYRIVESVEGVENSVCYLSTRALPESVRYVAGDVVSVIEVAEDQVIYLDPDASLVQIDTTEFEL